ncbi:MAG: type VI secretion system baseplate subunit TssG [Alphaproteobacteria bacterium]|jgi:type VI secretion system protein ImpH|nr:type VI secretion system baseplate subunit TssG [Alphaproteobacteria bacterium]
MATVARRTDSSLEEQIEKTPYEFDFHQAIRLLEKMRPEAHPLGEGSNPLKEAVSIESRVTLSPSGADIQSLTLSETDKPPVLTVNFVGLAGIQGPLPTPYTELLMERLRHKDTSFKDFLDMFNHRLASFWHRMRKKIVLGIAQVRPDKTPAGKVFLDLVGIESEPLRNRLAVSDQALLSFAPAFWKRPRSMVGLQRMLRSYFGLPIVVSQFQGGWQRPPEKDWTRIGVRELAQHQVLGKSAVLGQRSWQQTTGIALHIPPLTYKQYISFQQETALEFTALRDLTYFYIGLGQTVDVTFAVHREEIAPTLLNRQFGLGRTTWMTRGGGKGFPKDPEVRMVMRRAEYTPLSIPTIPEMRVKLSTREELKI